MFKLLICFDQWLFEIKQFKSLPVYKVIYDSIKSDNNDVQLLDSTDFPTLELLIDTCIAIQKCNLINKL